MWTEERIDLLKQMWADGYSGNIIASRLGGVTRNAVIGKVHRLGLSGRAATSRKSIHFQSNKRPMRKLRQLHAPSTTAAYNRAAIDRAIIEREAFRALPDLEIPIAERRTLLVKDDKGRLCANDAMDASACRWPFGDPQSPDFHFCNGKATLGLPYCDFHAKRAYNPVDTRRPNSVGNPLAFGHRQSRGANTGITTRELPEFDELKIG